MASIEPSEKSIKKYLACVPNDGAGVGLRREGIGKGHSRAFQALDGL